MDDKHYKNGLSAFVNQELSKEDRQLIAEHLLLCDDCRREHDTIKLGAAFGGTLRQFDAPNEVWMNIADTLDGRNISAMGLIPDAPSLRFNRWAAFAATAFAVSVLSIVAYVKLFGPETTHVRYKDQGLPQGSQPIASSSQSINGAIVPPSATDANSNQQTDQPVLATWKVETIAGTPKIGDSVASTIGVGQLLETDAKSSARIEVADIGTVDIAPNSRVMLAGTGENEHRLSLERGKLHAKIFAPPRLFVVDTPSGKAVDLGCEYTLQVDKNGNSVLHVTSGFVALERGGRESIVPAGMMCMMRGKGLGTPFSAETSSTFRRALEQFDFSGGGSKAVSAIVAEADYYDMFTLWHMLSRVPKKDRGVVYEALSQQVKPPAGVTREGVESLDRGMIEKWKKAVEAKWFE